MKHLFKEDHTLIIATVAIAALTAAALAYLLLTKKSDVIRAEIKHKIKDKVKDVAAGLVSEKIGISKNTAKKGVDTVAALHGKTT